MTGEPPLLVYVGKKIIRVTNMDGKIKDFPRCDITNIQSFVREMERIGKLDELLF